MRMASDHDKLSDAENLCAGITWDFLARVPEPWGIVDLSWLLEEPNKERGSGTGTIRAPPGESDVAEQRRYRNRAVESHLIVGSRCARLYSGLRPLAMVPIERVSVAGRRCPSEERGQTGLEDRGGQNFGFASCK